MLISSIITTVMNQIALSALVMGVIALLLGILITIVAKKFSIPVDTRTDEITQLLPGANCGGCGYSGCSGYAAALSSGEEKNTAKCSVGGQDTAQEVATYLGLTGGTFEAKVAKVHCQGNDKHTNKRFIYDGTQTCKNANQLHMGPGSCVYGCLGYGDCTNVCEFDAIHIKDGIAIVDSDKCTACGKCTIECPKHIIHLMPKHEKLHIVRCSNPLPALFVKKNCDIGCIGCQMCVKKCPVGAISMKDSLAQIDQEKCIHCSACKNVCPTKAITEGLDIINI